MSPRAGLPIVACILLIEAILIRPCFGQTLFTGSQISNGGGGSVSGLVAVGDFNRDGHPDLAASIYGAAEVSLLLGNGNGSFSSSGTLQVGAAPYAVIVSDFNADGKQDLATANEGSGDVSVLLGSGSGGFVLSQSPAVGAYPRYLVAGDFNEDGAMDLAVTNQGPNTLSVLLGNGNGTFQPQVTYPTGDIPRGIVAAYLNGDSHLDLIVANRGSFYTLSRYLGLGDGTFQVQAEINSFQARPNGLLGGDFNGDGKVDLCLGGEGLGYVVLVVGDGTGALTFGSRVTTSPGPGVPVEVAQGDFNGDGRTDIVASGYFSQSVGVLLGVGNGEFAPYLTFPTVSDPNAVAVGDFNGDGFDDVVVATDSSYQLTLLMNQAPFPDSCNDIDGDGYGAPGAPSCPGGALIDCDDAAAGVHPGAFDLCDGTDNNCDSLEGYNRDLDAYTTCQGDCDDSRSSVHPFAKELCDGIDQDCNGAVDVPAEEATGLQFDTATSFSWIASTENGVTYNIYRRTRTSSSFGAPTCFVANSAVASASDAQSPALGTAFAYLVSGRNTCGEGTLGADSSGTPRPNTLPCP